MNTAKVIEPAQANFMAREDFLRFLRDHGEAALRVAQQLGETYPSAVAEMRTIGLSHSASVKPVGPILKPHRRQRRHKADLDADTRGNRPDYWRIAGDGDSSIQRLQEEAARASQGIYGHNQEQTCAGESCGRLVPRCALFCRLAQKI